MGSQVLEILGAAQDGTIEAGALESVFQLLAPQDWKPQRVQLLMQSLGGAKEGRVNLGPLFQPEPEPLAQPMALKVAIFSASLYVRDFMQPFVERFPGSFFVRQDLSASTAKFAQGANAVCVFVNDAVDEQVVQALQTQGVRLVLLRCAGFDRVDLAATAAMGIKVLRVPAYSPYAVAEHAVSLVVTLNRRIHLAQERVCAGNYELSGLVGMDLSGKTAGILGTGKIGRIAAKIFRGFGMRVVCYDIAHNSEMEEMSCEYFSMDEVLAQADVLSLHVPLLPSTRYLINHETIAKMKPGVILVNVSRGALIDTEALIQGLSQGIIKAAGLDVYDKEAGLFFKDFSNMDDRAHMKHWDAKFALLRSFPNVLITPHSAFLTADALHNILNATIQNAEEFVAGGGLTNEVTALAAPAPKHVASPAPDVPVAKFAQECSPKRRASRVEPTRTSAPSLEVKVAVYSAAPYVKVQMQKLLMQFPKSTFLEVTCTAATAHLCMGADAVCLFVNDDASREVLSILKEQGVKLLLLRCAGYDRVDLEAAEEFGIQVARVPAYSPCAVAEHAVSLAMCLNRRLYRCWKRVRDSMFQLSGLVGKDLNGKTCGIVGTGKIGRITARIFKSMGMEVICYDVHKNDIVTGELGLQYVELDEIYARSDVISVHVPLLPSTYHMINAEAIAKMKEGVLLINVSRGALVDTAALVEGIAWGKIGGAGLDVYEKEQDIFFKNFSQMDDESQLLSMNHEFMHLRSLPNVVITPHSAFLTHEALANICDTTIQNVEEFVAGKPLTNGVQRP